MSREKGITRHASGSFFCMSLSRNRCTLSGDMHSRQFCRTCLSSTHACREKEESVNLYDSLSRFLESGSLAVTILRGVLLALLVASGLSQPAVASPRDAIN